MARTWQEVKSEALTLGLTEEGIARAQQRIDENIRAYLLAEIRKSRNVSQTELAQAMGVAQPRISQIERGDLNNAELSTLRSYVEALGGRLEILATFGDQHISIA